MKKLLLLLTAWLLVSVAYAQTDKDNKTKKNKNSFDINDFMSKMEELKNKEQAGNTSTGGNAKSTNYQQTGWLWQQYQPREGVV